MRPAGLAAGCPDNNILLTNPVGLLAASTLTNGLIFVSLTCP
jgi:hypothetical protein